MTDERVDPKNVVLTFPTFGVQAESTVVAALLEDLLSALQIPVLKSSDDHPAYERLLGTFVLDAVSTFYLNLKPRPYAALPLRHLTIALNDLGRGISNPIFDKPPNTSTPPDPTMFWLLRAESAALLKTLIDKKYEGQSKAADRIFRKIGHLLPRLTKRPFTSRPRILIDWLDKFQEAVVAEEKAKKGLIPKVPAKDEDGEEEASFAVQNFIAFARFKSHVANLSADWDKTDPRERLVWINRRLTILAEKYEKFQL